jgi:hypothetical protein
MTKRFRSVVTSDADHQRACATIVILLDNALLNIGSEYSSQSGPYGAATLQVQHISWLGPNIAHLRFPGRNGVEWDRIVRLDSHIAESIRYFMKGKQRHERIFPVKPIHVNDYLSELFSGSGHRCTAKDLRTLAANRYLKSYLFHLDNARLKYGLNPTELKRIFRGLSPKRQNKSTQCLVGIARSTAVEVVKEMQPRISIPPHLLPSKRPNAFDAVSDGPVGVVPFVATLLNIKPMALCKYNFDPQIILRYCYQWGWGKRAAEELFGAWKW